MVIRKSTLIDIQHALDKFSDDEKYKDEFLLGWITTSKTPNFYSIVAIESKQVIGLLNVMFNEGMATVMDLFSNGEEYIALINKMKHDLKPDVITIDAYNLKEFEDLGFKLVQANYLMVWEKPTEEPKEEVIVSGMGKETQEESIKDS